MMPSGPATGKKIQAMKRSWRPPFASRALSSRSDKDFGELAVVHAKRHSGIVRLVDIRPELQADACEAVQNRYGEDLIAGAIVTVTRDRTRLRPPLSDDTES